MRQGEQTIIAELAMGRRGTAQGFLEMCWAVGMGLGPFAAGAVSDTMNRSMGEDCDESCALARSLLLFVCIGMGGRALIALVAAGYFYGDMGRVRAEMGPTEARVEEPSVSALPPPEEAVAASGVAAGPVASVLGRSGDRSSDGSGEQEA